MSVRWEFPSNNHGLRVGISDSGIETFKAKPIAALAREICQNSLDAGKKDLTVRIEFDLYDFPTNLFPDYDNFVDAFDRSIHTWSVESNKKTVKILEEGKSLLIKENITFLRISDYNTTGLLGSDQLKNTHWHNLVKASGSSDKAGSSGGSYGIGKNATFACSTLRTVFYSTIDEDGLKASQGVAKLVSFNLGKEDDPTLESQGIGYHGEVERLQPVKECTSYQPGYTRTEPGTDIYIAGFKNEYVSDWDSQILKEILDNYLYAIYMGTLEIVIGHEIINNNTLAEVIAKHANEIHPNTHYYYEVLTSNKTLTFEEDIEGQGLIELKLLLGDEKVPKKVAMIRKPWMKIKEQDKINDLIPFVGVLVIKGEKLNQFLRKLENPSHNKWDPNLATSTLDKKLADTLLKRIKLFIAEKLKSMIGDESVESLDIEGAAEFLPQEEDEKEQSNKSDIETLTPRILDIKPIKKKEVKVANYSKEPEDVEAIAEGKGSYTQGDDSGVAQHGSGGSSESRSTGDVSVGVGEGEDLIEKRMKVGLDYIKFICVNKQESLYRIIFTPSYSSTDCILSLYQLDDQGERSSVDIEFAVRGEELLKVKHNKVLNFSIEKGREERIDIGVNKKAYFSAEVIIHGNQK